MYANMYKCTYVHVHFIHCLSVFITFFHIRQKLATLTKEAHGDGVCFRCMRLFMFGVYIPCALSLDIHNYVCTYTHVYIYVCINYIRMRVLFHQRLNSQFFSISPSSLTRFFCTYVPMYVCMCTHLGMYVCMYVFLDEFLFCLHFKGIS